MKIFHVAETIKGGVASVMKQLIKHQIVKNEVIILIPDSQSSELDNTLNCRWTYFRRTGRNCISFLSLLSNFIKLMIKSNPDVVHIHSSFAGVICRLALILLYPIRRPKVVYCPHAFSFLMSTSKVKLNVYVFLELILQCITDKIICTSLYEQDQAIINGMKKSKLCVIYNGIHFSTIQTESPYKNDSKKHILFVGRFDRQKGYDYFLQLIQHLDNQLFEFIIIGDSVHDDYQKIKSDNVHYLGWMKYEAIIPYFQHSTVLIMPSRWESFGLVAIEAQSFGLPVIANNCSSLPEVVFNEKTGYLFDFEKDISHVIDILNHKSALEWGKMKHDCIEFVTMRFSEKTMNDIVDNLYNDLMKKSF